MLKENKLLVNDCDEQRKSPVHHSLLLEWTNLSLILVDYGANLNCKDDFARKPYDEALAVASLKGGVMNKHIKCMFEEFHNGTLKRSTGKYDEPLYVKYLTPVEQVKELADFIKRVNDMSTLT
jgi:hypothetical protein